MVHAEWLQTLAEVAIAFAGFSGLIAGIRWRALLVSLLGLGSDAACALGRPVPAVPTLYLTALAEALYPDPGELQRGLLVRHPDLEELNRSIFSGRPRAG
jgi:hypothetical protein